jgi:hypothetical protein
VATNYTPGSQAVLPVGPPDAPAVAGNGSCSEADFHSKAAKETAIDPTAAATGE